MADWRRSRLIARVYDFWITHERLGAPGGRLLWGADMRRFYRDLRSAARPGAGERVLDVPCGGGTAFTALPPDAGGYVAVDVSALMLRRARDRARRRGLRLAGLLQADVTRLPLADGAFDRCLSSLGLHCFADPAAALAEMARVLRPGGALRGTAVVCGTGWRRDALIGVLRRAGAFGAVFTAGDLARMLGAAGFRDAEVRLDGAIARFSARRA
ncbi:hypothetical protein Skr01_08500 [Sphaerisporangium krabiense]|uniref:Ubiquinone/menaquinone biosynthesis C-methylase UbiE n=1 Tax=Sphaerisporangium krabiense TaxID=763782 RepID=A0A7W8ZCV5_9ACTN|nr:methyltransferase domain-containing protein [Sphaerisporangium krabiense]MBB5631348.1 ubiquinone/menaquinone biosynthesis C-methylase UbiE [Sphaerisporangium krabiense]GII60765.1 hypothetical protein Skr01_08500 [Sphaerisporangium krabiense]